MKKLVHNSILSLFVLGILLGKTGGMNVASAQSSEPAPVATFRISSCFGGSEGLAGVQLLNRRILSAMPMGATMVPVYGRLGALSSEYAPDSILQKDFLLRIQNISGWAEVAVRPGTAAPVQLTYLSLCGQGGEGWRRGQEPSLFHDLRRWWHPTADSFDFWGPEGTSTLSTELENAERDRFFATARIRVHSKIDGVARSLKIVRLEMNVGVMSAGVETPYQGNLFVDVGGVYRAGGVR